MKLESLYKEIGLTVLELQTYINESRDHPNRIAEVNEITKRLVLLLKVRANLVNENSPVTQ